MYFVCCRVEVNITSKILLNKHETRHVETIYVPADISFVERYDWIKKERELHVSVVVLYLTLSITSTCVLLLSLCLRFCCIFFCWWLHSLKNINSLWCSWFNGRLTYKKTITMYEISCLKCNLFRLSCLLYQTEWLTAWLTIYREKRYNWEPNKQKTGKKHQNVQCFYAI